MDDFDDNNYHVLNNRHDKGDHTISIDMIYLIIPYQ